jgi:hypothetical protein
MRCKPVLFALLSAAGAVAGLAQDSSAGWQLGAFGTLGVAATNTNTVGYPRNTFQPSGATHRLDPETDSRLGVQLRLPLGESLFATLQGVSQYPYDGTYRPAITWATLTWNPVSTFTVRAGRESFELLESGRNENVGYSYLWVRPPVEVFSQSVLTAIDGLDLTQTFDLGSEARLSLKAWAGRSVGMAPLRTQSQPMDFSGGHDIGGHASLAIGPWRGRIELWQTQVPHEIPPPTGSVAQVLDGYAAKLKDPGLARSGSLFPVQGAIGRGYSAGLVFEQGPVQAEALFTRGYFDRYLFNSNQSGYLSLGYRLGKVMPYGMFARSRSAPQKLPYLGVLPELTDPTTRKVVAGITELVNGLVANQYTYTAGVRWDFSDHADFKLQVDRVWSQGPPLVINLQPGFSGNLTVVSAVVDFVFGGGR